MVGKEVAQNAACTAGPVRQWSCFDAIGDGINWKVGGIGDTRWTRAVWVSWKES